MATGLRPHGWSGLKSVGTGKGGTLNSSPPTRVEWIEITILLLVKAFLYVSAHTGGVD